jgi:hypothetical protein
LSDYDFSPVDCLGIDHIDRTGKSAKGAGAERAIKIFVSCFNLYDGELKCHFFIRIEFWNTCYFWMINLLVMMRNEEVDATKFHRIEAGPALSSRCRTRGEYSRTSTPAANRWSPNPFSSSSPTLADGKMIFKRWYTCV